MSSNPKPGMHSGCERQPSTPQAAFTRQGPLVRSGVDPVPWTVLSLWSLAPVLRIFIPPGLHAAQSAAHAAEALP